MTINQDEANVAGLLQRCEESGLAPKYDESEDSRVDLSSNGDEIFVVSDLHLASGRESDGTYDGTENFFSDSSFSAFLKYAHDNLKSNGAMLIINGDFVDFLRIARTPQEEREFKEWYRILDQLGASQPIDRLKASISKKERKYGLKTNDYKSVLRLHVAIEGHSQFFDALADWLAHGHRLIIVRGNHDLEWYWRLVRNYLRFALAQRLAGRQHLNATLDLQRALGDVVLPGLTFIHNSLLIDGEFYVEHGHRYDKFAHVVGPPTLGDGQELNIPFGSFFNRYLLNTIELNYPFLDNIRPSTNILPILIRERFPLAIKLLWQHVPFMLRIIPKGYYRYMFGRVFLVALAVLVPVAILIWQGWDLLTRAAPQASGSSIVGSLGKTGLGVVTNLGWLIVSYILGRIVAYFQLEEPASLAKFARSKSSENLQYRLITFGHTHNPEQFAHEGRWFYNTGTWIPIIENSSAEVRENKTYTFLHVSPGASGEPEGTRDSLRRWNHTGEPAEPLVLISRAGA